MEVYLLVTYFRKSAYGWFQLLGRLSRYLFLIRFLMKYFRYLKKQVLRDDWKSTYILSTNMLYRPRISNLESGDAFCVISNNDTSQLMLIVLQITVGSKHPVKVNGLVQILRSFAPEIRSRITSKILLFVTDKHGILNCTHPLHNQDDKVAR